MDFENRIKLAHIIDNLDRGGTQTWLCLLAAGLTRRNYQQIIFCLNEKTNIDVVRNLQDSGIEVVVIGRTKIFLGIGFLSLLLQLRRAKVDAVFTILPYGNFIGRIIGRLSGQKIIFSTIRTRNIDKSFFLLQINRLTAFLSKKIIFNSQEVVPFAMAHEGVKENQVEVIPNGCNLPSLNTAAVRTEIRYELGVNSDTNILGCVSRLHPQKGLFYLISAFSDLIKKKPDSQLWILGDGPLRKELENKVKKLGIEKNVNFWGDSSNVQEFLCAIDVFVHPSLFEGMPNAVLEAMGAGKPVIASAVDGVNEVIIDGESGFLVEPKDINGLAIKMLEVLQTPGKWKEIGNQAREYVKTNHSVEKMVAKYDDCFKKCMADNSSINFT